MTILSKLRISLRTTPRLPRDTATVELALRYAALLDDLFVRLDEHEAVESGAHHRRVIMEIDTIGKRLDAVLDRLGMSPGARPAVREADPGGDPDSATLDALRYDAAGGGAAGVDYTEAVDPTVAETDT